MNHYVYFRGVDFGEVTFKKDDIEQMVFKCSSTQIRGRIVIPEEEKYWSAEFGPIVFSYNSLP